VQHGLNEPRCQTLLVSVFFDAVSFNRPQRPQAVQDRFRILAELLSFQFQSEAIIEPVARKEAHILDWVKGQRHLD
jgi:hypothetical protein